MARPTAARASGVVAVATLLLLLLPGPASSQAAAAAAGLRAAAKSPLLKKILRSLAKEAAIAGGSAGLKKAMGSSKGGGSNVNRLGAAAADNAGIIVYSIPVGGQSVSGAVNIFKDFTWVQCPAGYSGVTCESPTCQTVLNITPDYCDSSASVDNCEYEYGSDDDGTKTSGYLARETLTVDRTTGSMAFGCNTTAPPDGETSAIGFSKGNLSIPTQLGISRFSYFLTPDDSNTPESTSVVLLGEQAVPQTKHSHSTPLVDSTGTMYPDLYYVRLTGIQVDGEPLTSIPSGTFDIAVDGNSGSGGVVLSTTTAITYLQEDGYNAVKQALVNAIKSVPVSSTGTNADGFDLCYSINSVAKLTFPKITMVFDGQDSPAMELTTVHYFYKDTQSGLQCLTMLPMPSDVSLGAILGSMMQAGTNMIYDVSGKQLIFEKAAAVLSVVTSHVFLMLMLLLVVVFLF